MTEKKEGNRAIHGESLQFPPNVVAFSLGFTSSEILYFCTGSKYGIWCKADTLGNLLIVTMTPPILFLTLSSLMHHTYILCSLMILYIGYVHSAHLLHIPVNCKHEGKGRKRLSLKSKGRENLLRSNSCLDTHKSLY